ncbi:MAG TPA: lipopolysaccharide assembly protein LapA domain-containing protein [Acidimicrobiales bacterium]|jgi:uncharacterized integral membrane protein|nr:lipopolysaccharide assembly protein LapA domain-containing protein [Acidimicrobiales bacterium]
MEPEPEPQVQRRANPGSGVDVDPVVSGPDQPAGAPAPVRPPTDVPPSRAGRLWVGLILALIFLVVILVFIFQNLHSVKISFFTASGSFPLALIVLLAAVLGASIVLLLGSIRILQLRRTVRHRSRMAHPPDDGLR